MMSSFCRVSWIVVEDWHRQHARIAGCCRLLRTVAYCWVLGVLRLRAHGVGCQCLVCCGACAHARTQYMFEVSVSVSESGSSGEQLTFQNAMHMLGSDLCSNLHSVSGTISYRARRREALKQSEREREKG